MAEYLTSILVPVPEDTFAVRLRLAIAATNITGDQLARKTNLHQNTISRYANGTHQPSFLSASTIANALNFPIQFFVGEHDCK